MLTTSAKFLARSSHVSCPLGLQRRGPSGRHNVTSLTLINQACLGQNKLLIIDAINELEIAPQVAYAGKPHISIREQRIGESQSGDCVLACNPCCQHCSQNVVKDCALENCCLGPGVSNTELLPFSIAPDSDCLFGPRLAPR